MTKKIIASIVVFSLIFITSCSYSDNSSKDKYDGSQWLENTLRLVDNSYAEDMDIGGFVQSQFLGESIQFDLLNTVWYFETLSYLGEKEIFVDNKAEYQMKIKELLEKYKQNDSLSLAYIYWSVLDIFSKVNIEPPNELISEIRKYIEDNSDFNGFALTVDRGLSIEDITLLYCKIGILLNDLHYINKVHIDKALVKAINQKNDSLIITLANINQYSNNLDGKNKKILNEYFVNYVDKKIIWII